MSINQWCRKCKKWFSGDYHFYNKDKGSWDGCGQSKENQNIRYHPARTLIGDIWKLPLSGKYILIDYIDPFCTGITDSNGETAGCKYTASLEQLLKNESAILISTFEEESPDWADERGWNGPKELTGAVTLKQRLDFLSKRIKDYNERNQTKD